MNFYVLFWQLISTLLVINTEAQFVDEPFREFKKKFYSESLPFVYNRKCFTQYAGVIYNDLTNNHQPNKYPDISNSKFISKIQSIQIKENQVVQYRAGLNFGDRNNSTFLGIFVDVVDTLEKYENASWLLLCIYNQNGELKDNLILSGIEINQVEQYCKVGINYDIEIKRFDFLPDSPDDLAINAELTETKIIVNEDCFFQVKERIRTKGKFRTSLDSLIQLE